MKWTLRRLAPIVDALFGSLTLGTGGDVETLENHPHAIPAGAYVVQLTDSKRARAGTLWCPANDFRLPELLSVPNRDGIRIHALNEASETSGCIGVGRRNGDVGLLHSRDTLIRLVNLLRQCELHGERVELEVRDVDVEALPAPAPIAWDGTERRSGTERREAERRTVPAA